VDIGLFQPTPKPPTPPARFIYIGTLAPWQGLEHLLEAFKRASKTCDIRLTIMGKARKERLKTLIKNVRKLKISELVNFEEAVNHEDVPLILNRHHVGVAPFIGTERNLKQGFCPIKLLEYMACGLAVITSDLPAVRELVEHEREAILYKPNNTNRLAEAIVHLAQDESLRLKLANAGVQRAKAFSWEEACKKLMLVYKSLIAT
jgi:glycosyltransferase involved in cell wall biosynthesis